MDNRKAFLKKRSGAALVALIVIVVFSLFAINRSLGARMNNVSDLFYEGVDGNAAIADLLKERCAASLNLITTANHHDAASAEADSLRSARTELLDMLDDGAVPSELFDANVKLSDAFSELYAALEASELTAGETADIKAEQKRMETAVDEIDDSGYNEVADDFDDDFFTNLLMGLCVADRPEPFK